MILFVFTFHHVLLAVYGHCPHQPSDQNPLEKVNLEDEGARLRTDFQTFLSTVVEGENDQKSWMIIMGHW